MLQRSLAQLLKIGVFLVLLYCYYLVTIWMSLRNKNKGRKNSLEKDTNARLDEGLHFFITLSFPKGVDIWTTK